MNGDKPDIPVPIVAGMPKKYCLIKLMFAINNDGQALAVKKVLDQAVQDIPDKRYTFEITQN